MRSYFGVPRSAARSLLTAACGVLLAGCAYALVNGNSLNQAKVDKVEDGLQQIRQLSFLRPVPLVVKDRDQAEQQMESDLMRDYTDNQLRADGAAGALVGLYPAGIDLKAESLKLLRNQVAGFYDPHSKEMVLVAGGTNLGFFTDAAEFVAQHDVGGEMVLAHELTHALQDQHFDLDKKLDQVKNNDDRALAIKSVAEGDATLAGYAYVTGRMDASVVDALLAYLPDIAKELTKEAPDTPDGLSVPLIFQYCDGARFVAEAYRRGGWKAVDALYANPPLSTHQVIHPEDYFVHPKPPLSVTIHGYERTMSSWSKVDDDTYGELLLRVILQRNLGKDAPEVALAGRWAGDQMVILQSGRQISVIWLLVFAESGTAAKFAAVYTTTLDKLLGKTRHEVDYRDREVLVTIGAAAQAMETLEPSIWSASRIGVTTGPNYAAPPVARLDNSEIAFPIKLRSSL
jgi:hypothetical protein